MSKKLQNKIYSNQFHDFSKLLLIEQIRNLLSAYHGLVLLLSDLFLSNEKQKELLIEISMIEELIKSKLIISSSMRGF